MNQDLETQTPFLDALHEIDITRSRAKTMLMNLLISRGWKSTFLTPGSFWVWEKKLEGGRTVLTDSDTALQFEIHNYESKIN